jgi:hypothetical protein
MKTLLLLISALSFDSSASRPRLRFPKRLCSLFLAIPLLGIPLSAFSQTPTPSPSPTASPVQTFDITFQWDPPRPADNVTITRFYKKLADGTYVKTNIEVPQPANQTRIPVKTGDVYAITFVNGQGLESIRSGDASVDVTVPAAPNNFRIVFTGTINGVITPNTPSP